MLKHPVQKSLPLIRAKIIRTHIYIECFDRLAVGQKWPEDTWTVNLSALLREKALDVYSRLSIENSLNYDKIKNALVKRYRLTEEGYRVKYRACRPKKIETPSQLSAHMSSYYINVLTFQKLIKIMYR